MSELAPVAADDVRVGDDERRAVDERLHRAVGLGQLTLLEYEERAAVVWAARTRGELGAVVRDLPGAPVAVPAGGPTRRVVAVMGEERLEGPVGDGQAVEGWAVMGSTRLDLRRDDLPGRVRVRAVAVMGEVEVLVPDGATVQLSGAAVMGDRSVRLAPSVPGGPVVELFGLSVMGSVKVRSAGVPTGLARVAQTVRGWTPAPAAPPVGRRHRGRAYLVGLAVAGAVALGGLGGYGVQGGGGGQGDDVLRVQPDQSSIVVPRGSGDVTVVVPDGVRVEVERQGSSGEVDCDAVCTLVSDRVVTVVVERRSGDVEIESASEFD